MADKHYIHLMKKIAIFLLVVTLFSCSKSSSPDMIFSIPLSTRLENPTPAGRTETGTLTMQLYGNNTLRYSFQVDNLSAGDQLTMAHFYAGDPVTNGPIILSFPPFSGTSSSGEITLRESLADSLNFSSNNIYFNIHSTQFPTGLVRGMVNINIIAAEDVPMNGLNEVPPVITTATGRALIRLTIDRKLYSLVTVADVPGGETVTAAHIHRGAAGVNGAILIGLCANATDFGISKMVQLDEATANAVKTEVLYTNVHTNLHSDGLIRGQIR